MILDIDAARSTAGIIAPIVGAVIFGSESIRVRASAKRPRGSTHTFGTPTAATGAPNPVNWGVYRLTIAASGW